MSESKSPTVIWTGEGHEHEVAQFALEHPLASIGVATDSALMWDRIRRQIAMYWLEHGIEGIYGRDRLGLTNGAEIQCVVTRSNSAKSAFRGLHLDGYWEMFIRPESWEAQEWRDMMTSLIRQPLPDCLDR